ncbi:monocarboxylate transporter 12-like [Asterias rubens]|uniref:monocarboxylate transporter 12-like n=1 Tax=Asterias rubens TaxID=7604 RepID=UPI001454F4F1|nr:monocarboxylate transporter 12-like [Asterias rubens]
MHSEWRGWGVVIVIASHLLYILQVGFTRCAGILFNSLQNAFLGTAAQTGAIISIMTSAAYFGCVFGGVLCNRYGCRSTAMLGGVMQLTGMVASSICQTIQQMYIASFFIGLGSSWEWSGATVAVTHYFTKHYSLANGLVSVGYGIGYLSFPPIMQQLLVAYGWRGTLLVTSAVSANMCACAALFRPRLRNQRSQIRKKFACWRKLKTRKEQLPAEEKTIDPTVASQEEPSPLRFDCKRIWAFLTRVLSFFRLDILARSYRFILLTVLHLIHVSPYAAYMLFIIPRAITVDVDESSASFLLSVFGIANMVGRLSSSIIVYKIPPSLVYSVAMLLASGAVLLGQFNSYIFFVLSVSTLGSCIGTVSITAMVITRRLVGAENMGSAIGFYQVLGGVGDLLGPIFAGALYDATEDYQVMFYIIAGIFFFCFLLTTLLPLLRKIEPGIDLKERGDTAVSNPNPHSVPYQYSSLQSIQMTV